MRVASSLRVLVIAGWLVLLKLCFQVFIVLSSADEAGTCRMYEGAWGGAVSKFSRVRGADRRSRSDVSYRVAWVRPLLSCSNRLVAKVKWITARTATKSGARSSVSVVDLPPSKREKSSSFVCTPKIFRRSLHLTQCKTKCSLDSTASPHSQRLDSTALMLCKYPFDGVMPVRSCARMLACLWVRSSYMRRVCFPGHAVSILRRDAPTVAGTCSVARLRRSCVL